MKSFAVLGALSLLVPVVAACGDTSAGMPGGPDGRPGSTIDARAGTPDARHVGPDATPPVDAPPPGPDGTPVRQACTNTFGAGLTAVHGRLDGTLVSIVEPGHHGCNGDTDHVHLQVSMKGAIYDVAINVVDPANVDFAERDMAIPDGPWSEGWHPNDLLDYPALGLHTADFTATPTATLSSTITNELATVNHISVFMTGYGPDGGHEVHRRGGGLDGALVLQPLSATPHLLFFHFSTQSF